MPPAFAPSPPVMVSWNLHFDYSKSAVAGGAVAGAR